MGDNAQPSDSQKDMQISWVRTTEADGVFPRLKDHQDRLNNGHVVYHIPTARQPQLDFLRSKGFEIVEDRSAMKSGTVFLDTEYAAPDSKVLGAAYAYQRDLVEKLGAHPLPQSARAVAAGQAPTVLNSGG